MTAPSVQIGFPEFWGRFYAKFGPALQCLKGAETALNGLVDREWPAVDGRQRVILNLARLNGVSMEELIILAANGCGHGAMKILRSMLETTIDAEYLQRHTGAFEDYREWGHVARWGLYKSLERNAPKAYAAIADGERERAQREFARLRERFTNPRTGRLQTRWCGRDLGREAEEAGLADLYGCINPLASQMLHGNMFGLELHFEAAQDPHRIDVPPGFKWSQQALVGGHFCVVQSISTLAQALGAEPAPSIRELVSQCNAVWAQLADTEGGQCEY